MSRKVTVKHELFVYQQSSVRKHSNFFERIIEIITKKLILVCYYKSFVIFLGLNLHSHGFADIVLVSIKHELPIVSYVWWTMDLSFPAFRKASVDVRVET